MDKQEVYEACKRLVDADKGYEALACLSKMLEERNTELEILANHKCVVVDTIKKFTRIDIPTTAKGLRSRIDVIGDLLEDE